MKALKFLAIPALALAAGSISVAQTTGTTQEPQSAEKALPASSPGPAWPEEPRWTGPGPMPRHYLITRWGIPEPYTSMTNPLPRKHAILKRGKAVYKEHCASCHGDQGAGDGEARRRGLHAMDHGESPSVEMWHARILPYVRPLGMTAR